MKSVLKYATAASVLAATNAQLLPNITEGVASEPVVTDTGSGLFLTTQSIRYGDILSLRIGMNATNVNVTQPNPLPQEDGGLWFGLTFLSGD
jgi:hypothetical protein